MAVKKTTKAKGKKASVTEFNPPLNEATAMIKASGAENCLIIFGKKTEQGTLTTTLSHWGKDARSLNSLISALGHLMDHIDEDMDAVMGKKVAKKTATTKKKVVAKKKAK